jgi:hypothetical protein
MHSLEHEPTLLEAIAFEESDIGSCEWDGDHNSDLLSVSNAGFTIGWESRKPEYRGKYYGKFAWNVIVEEMARAQIGVGFMLLWDTGPDWGFFGYLGSSRSAWAYDPSTGDVVHGTSPYKEVSKSSVMAERALLLCTWTCRAVPQVQQDSA